MEEQDDATEIQSFVKAIRTGNVHLLRHMIRTGLQKSTQNTLDVALHESIRNGNDECFQIMLQGGACLQSLNKHQETLLLTALNTGRPHIVQALFREGYQVDYNVGNSLDTGQIVPLQLAIIRNQPRMVELLLKQGANTEFCDVDRDTAIITATNAESIEIVRMLLRHGANVNAVGYEGNTALHRAVELNNIELLKCLLQSNPMVDVHNEQGNTALLLATEFGYLECVNALLQAGAKPGSTNNADQNALHLTIMDGNLDIIQKLIEDSDLDLNAVDSAGNTATIMAAFLKHTHVCLYLIEKGADVSLRGELQRSVIHWAAAHGLNEVVKVLTTTAKAVDIESMEETGDTPILLATQSGHYDCVQLLLASGADPSKQGSGKFNCLHWMAIKGCTDDLFQTVLDKVTDVNARDEDLCTPIILLAKFRRYSFMQALLDRKDCDINAMGKDGRTALHWVCNVGHHDMVWQLLKRDASADILDAAVDTPLHLACKSKHVEVVEELLNHGANANLRDGRDRIPLHWACSESQLDIANVILCAPTQLDVVDNDGDAPIHLASRTYNEAIVETLVASGADCNVFDAKGRTALCYVAETGNTKTVTLLLESGALVNSERFRASPLIQACKKCNVEVVRLLLEHRADTEHQDDLGRTAFLWALAKGSEDIARLLVEHGTKTRHRDKSGDTALTLAAWHGHPDLISYLLPLSDIEHKEEEEGMTALHLAIGKDNRECVRVMLDAGADVSHLSRSGNNALILAAIHTSGPDVMNLVLNCGQQLDYNAKGEKGRAALHWAVGDPDSVAVLLAKTPPGTLDLDSEDENGASPLLLAIAHEQPESARLLIEAGCDPNRLHRDGRRPLHHCALYGDCTTMETLLGRCRIDPDTPTQERRTALLMASIEGNVDIVKLLLKHGCCVNSIFKDAITPLSTAADRRFYEIMELLLRAGADPDVIGGERHTPLMTCTFQEDLRGMQLLLKANADVNQCIDSGGNRLLHVTIMKNNTNALLLLLAAGFGEEHIRNVLNDGVLSYLIQSPVGMAALKAACASPRPLQQLCRLAIRKVLQYPLQQKLEKLDLPAMMKGFLAMNDIEKIYDSKAT